MEITNGKSLINKSEILFIYDSTYSIPNGDPFTGEQRYDDETKRVLVSDVRIKRFIRDYFLNVNQYLTEGDQYEVYVWNDQSQAGESGSGAAARMRSLKANYNGSALDILRKCIDVRLFGGISTEEGDAANLTGPVQFALLNPSLNQVELRIHQNTSVFVSSVEKTRGAIGTTTVIPYCVNQIHGWVNPFSAMHTGLNDEDVSLMFSALWQSINNANTRTKSNQNSLLLIQIIYADPIRKLYGVDRFVNIKPLHGKRSESIRGLADFSFEFSQLAKEMKSDIVDKVKYYSQIEPITKQLKEAFEQQGVAEKLEVMILPSLIPVGGSI